MASHNSVRTLAVVAFLGAALSASAQLRSFTGYNTNVLPANDDGSTGLVSLGFSANFFGTTHVDTFINNNGNITFDESLASYTPFGLAGSNRQIIAPFFADVDTRASGSVTYGSGLLGGHAAFAVNWSGVGAFATLPVYNTFQLVLISRADVGVGDFDFEFNYTDINWEAGTYSGGNSSGLGGSTARVGYSSGGGAPVSFELTGSGVAGAFLDTNLVSGLIYNQSGTPFDGASMNGRYTFQVRNGEVLPSLPVPEPSTYGLIAAASLLAGTVLRRRLAKVKA